MKLQIVHAAPQLRSLDRIEATSYRDLKSRFTAAELADLMSGLHVETDLATIKAVRHAA